MARDICDGSKANKPATDRLKTFYPQTIHLYETWKHLLAITARNSMQCIVCAA